MTILRERITRINLGAFLNWATGWSMRVWRQEPLDTIHAPNQSGIDPDIHAAMGRFQGTPAFPLEVASQVLKVDRVNAVEVVDISGAGEVLYKDWP